MSYKRNHNKIYNKMKLVIITLTLALLSNNISSQRFRIRPRRSYPVEPDEVSPDVSPDFPDDPIDFPLEPYNPPRTARCIRKSGDPETDADCCAKQNRPRWCPNISQSSAKRNLSRLNRSSRARRFASKEITEYRSKNASSGSRSSFGGPGGQSQALTFQNFWWPWFCGWNSWCCFWCYLVYIWWGNNNWWRYHWCIWSRCMNFPY